MLQRQLLIVEDDTHISDIVAQHLQSLGYACTQAYSGTDGLLFLDRRSFDLIITDLMLPGSSGEDIVRAARFQKARIPVIVISARTAVADKVDLLRLGADDYLSKPFDLDELAARVEVQLRRYSPDEESSTVRYGDWVLDHNARTLVSKGEIVPLTRTEYNVVELLVSKPNKVFAKDELYRQAWGEKSAEGDGTVSAHISNIRSKLRPTGTDSYIRTVWGTGFKLSNAQR